MARNPKDTIVSYYYAHKTMKYSSFTGTFDQFVEYFMEDKGLYRISFNFNLFFSIFKRNPFIII